MYSGGPRDNRVCRGGGGGPIPIFREVNLQCVSNKEGVAKQWDNSLMWKEPLDIRIA